MITTTQTQTSDLKAEYNFGYIWLISIVAALGGLLFGYDWVVIGGAKLFFESHFNLPVIAQSLQHTWPFSNFELNTITANISGFVNSAR